METFSALLAICAGNSPVPGEFPTQRPVALSFDVFFDLHPNKRLSEQWWGWWFETPSCPSWRQRNAESLIAIYVDDCHPMQLSVHTPAHLLMFCKKYCHKCYINRWMFFLCFLYFFLGLAKTIDEYDVIMPVSHVRMMSQINCGDVPMLSQ